MSISGLEDKIRFEKFWVDGDCLCLKLSGRKTAIRRAKTISSRLAEASTRQLLRFEVLGNGEGVSWPELDEDLSAAFLAYPERFAVSKKKNVA